MRSPSSRKMRRIAVESSTVAATLSGSHRFMSIDSATWLGLGLMVRVRVRVRVMLGFGLG